MVRTQARFKKADIRRAVEAILALGLPVISVKIAPDGSIGVATAQTGEEASMTELDQWISKHAR